jgi:hypothetical protein
MFTMAKAARSRAVFSTGHVVGGFFELWIFRGLLHSGVRWSCLNFPHMAVPKED